MEFQNSGFVRDIWYKNQNDPIRDARISSISNKIWNSGLLGILDGISKFRLMLEDSPS